MFSPKANRACDGRNRRAEGSCSNVVDRFPPPPPVLVKERSARSKKTGLVLRAGRRQAMEGNARARVRLNDAFYRGLRVGVSGDCQAERGPRLRRGSLRSAIGSSSCASLGWTTSWAAKRQWNYAAVESGMVSPGSGRPAKSGAASLFRLPANCLKKNSRRRGSSTAGRPRNRRPTETDYVV